MPDENEAKEVEEAPIVKPVPPVAEPKIDDFICMGRYTLIVCLLGEFLILTQLGNVGFY
jgi:hypothetical protein